MNDGAEYTPDEIVTELIPANLTPEAVIRGKQPETDIVWSANVIVNRGPVDDPDFVSTTGSCTVSDAKFGYSEMMLEESAIVWLADRVGADLEDLTVVSFRWSTLMY